MAPRTPLTERAREQLRALLDSQSFGVLATVGDDHPHATVMYFASTPEAELYFLINETSRKGENAAANPLIAYLVDRRDLAAEHPERFARAEFTGTLRRIERDSTEFKEAYTAFERKVPMVLEWLKKPRREFYKLAPEAIRFSAGSADPPIDYDPRSHA